MNSLSRLIEHHDYPRYYRPDFEESVIPFTQKEIEEIMVIPQEQALTFWELGENPPRFIRNACDLDEAKYPLKIACDCDFFIRLNCWKEEFGMTPNVSGYSRKYTEKLLFGSNGYLSKIVNRIRLFIMLVFLILRSQWNGAVLFAIGTLYGEQELVSATL
jgi:hypothetical protein